VVAVTFNGGEGKIADEQRLRTLVEIQSISSLSIDREKQGTFQRVKPPRGLKGRHIRDD
jgi:hypothetical protein